MWDNELDGLTLRYSRVAPECATPGNTKYIFLRRSPAGRRPNEVNTALNAAETENGLTDAAYLGPASVFPPAAVVPSSSKMKKPYSSLSERLNRPRRWRRWPLGAMGRNQVMDLWQWATETH